MATQLTRLLEPNDQAAAWAALKDALAQLERAPHTAREGVARWTGFVARARERVWQQRYSRPVLILILDGRKQVALETGPGMAETTLVATEGQILLVPPMATLNMINEPDPQRGIYRAFCMELLSEVDERLQKRYPSLCVQRGFGGFEGERPHLLRSALPSIQALHHLASTLLLPDAHALLIVHRLEDLLLTLLLQHREQLEAQRAAASTLSLDPVLAVRTLVRRDPARAWTAEEVARSLGMSNATLRRRLGELGVSFRNVMWRERLNVAKMLLRSGRHSVLEVATACGYESASRFAAQFRRSEGISPSAYRAQHAAPTVYGEPAAPR